MRAYVTGGALAVRGVDVVRAFKYRFDPAAEVERAVYLSWGRVIAAAGVGAVIPPSRSWFDGTVAVIVCCRLSRLPKVVHAVEGPGRVSNRKTDRAAWRGTVGTVETVGEFASETGSSISWRRAVQERCVSFDRRLDETVVLWRSNRSVTVAAWVASRVGDIGAVSVVGWWLFVSPRRALVTAASISVQAVALNFGVKKLFRRSRPAGPAHTSSLPSGHVATAVAAATLAPVGSVTIVSAAAATCAAGRVVGRDHWLSDTVAGALVGLSFGCFAKKVLNRVG